MKVFYTTVLFFAVFFSCSLKGENINEDDGHETKSISAVPEPTKHSTSDSSKESIQTAVPPCIDCAYVKEFKDVYVADEKMMKEYNYYLKTLQKGEVKYGVCKAEHMSIKMVFMFIELRKLFSLFNNNNYQITTKDRKQKIDEFLKDWTTSGTTVQVSNLGSDKIKTYNFAAYLNSINRGVEVGKEWSYKLEYESIDPPIYLTSKKGQTVVTAMQSVKITSPKGSYADKTRKHFNITFHNITECNKLIQITLDDITVRTKPTSY